MSLFGKKSKSAQTVSAVQLAKSAEPPVEYEARLAQAERRNSTILGVFAGVCGLIALLSVASVLILIPFQKLVPMMVYVDKTGATQVAQVVEPTIMTSNESVARHFVAKYVATRERYLYQLLQDDFNFVVATTDSPILAEYASKYEGPNKKDAILGDRVEEKIRLVSVVLSPSTAGRATVRFVKETWAVGSRTMQKSENFIADMAYGWDAVNGWNDTTLLLNPLGFKVQAYRVSPEFQ